MLDLISSFASRVWSLEDRMEGLVDSRDLAREEKDTDSADKDIPNK